MDEGTQSTDFQIGFSNFVTDSDTPTSSLTYSISGGADASLFTIDPSTGELTFIGDFELDYETEAQYVLRISVSDGSNTTTTRIIIDVTDINEAPMALPDVAAGTENETLTIDVLANDADPDKGDGSNALSVGVLSTSGGGTTSVKNNQLVFDPGADFDSLSTGETATVTIVYQVSDDEGLAATSTATVTITGTNEAPIAVEDNATVSATQISTIDVLANDTDVDLSLIHI